MNNSYRSHHNETGAPNDVRSRGPMTRLRPFLSERADAPSVPSTNVWSRFAVAVVATGTTAIALVVVPAGGHVLAAPTTRCVFDSGSATLTIETVEDPAATTPNAITVARTPDTDAAPRDNGRFQVSWPGQIPDDCGGATVSNVDLVVVQAHGRRALTVTVDVANGPFAPGKTTTLDPFRAGGAEDHVPEIEFDMHLPAGASDVSGLRQYPPVTLEILGSAGRDHFVVGQRVCPNPEDPRCRDALANLNAHGDVDPDVLVTFGAGNEANTATALGAGAAKVVGGTLKVRLDGRAGDDILDGQGTGIGVPFRLAPITEKFFIAEGGAGDDRLTGTALDMRPSDPSSPDFVDDELVGGAGNDVLVGHEGDDHLLGGAGNDRLLGDGGDDILDGGTGDDVVDEGAAANGGDHMLGGDGVDVVDYSLRSAAIVAYPGDNPGSGGGAGDGNVRDDGEVGELDNVGTDIEDVRLAPAGAGAGLRVLGELPALTGIHCRNHQGAVDGMAPPGQSGPCALLVDPDRNLGISVGQRVTWGADTPLLRVYDLDEIAAPPREIPCPEDTCPLRLTYSALDPVFGRLYTPPPPWKKGDAGLDTVQRNPCVLAVLEYTAPTLALDHALDYGVDGKCPAGTVNFVTLAVASVPDGSGLLLSGAIKEEFGPRRPSGNYASGLASPLTDVLAENLGQALLVRWVDVSPAGGLSYGWDLDLRGAGCGRRIGWKGLSGRTDVAIAPFVTRMGSDLLAYCWDPQVQWYNKGTTGEPGYVVRIPLDPATGRPLGRDGKALPPSSDPYVSYRSVRTPTLPGYLQVVADHTSRQLMLVTDDGANGNGVWLFDAKADRFVGVVTGGFVASPRNNTSVGLDTARGRVYLLTEGGVLMVPARQRPLPPGLIYPAGKNPARRPDWANLRQIGVAPKLRRLFVPINFPDQVARGPRYLVLEDAIPDAPPSVVSDPDANTVQVAESERTDVRTSAHGSGVGVHMVWTGGVNRTVRSVDPACSLSLNTGNDGIDASFPFSVEGQFLGTDRCLADFVAGPGHREMALGTAVAESGSGSVAAGAPLTFAPADVTDKDVKSVGQCEAGAVGTVTRGNLPSNLSDPYARQCDDFWDSATGHVKERDAKTGSWTGNYHDASADDQRRLVPDPRTGTRGRDGAGFPVPGSACADFGSGPSSSSAEAAPTHASTAACDQSASTSYASSSSTGVTLAHEGTPLLSVGSASSAVRTWRDPAEGQVTLTVATASDVRVGPLAIREMRSVARTRAKGRTDTAVAEFARRWCGLTFVDEAVTGLPEELRAQAAAVEAAVTAEAAEARALRRQATACIDPGEPDNVALLETLNQLLLGKVRIGLTAPNVEKEPDGRIEAGEDSPGGYQAVVIKHPDARGGDTVVNDDDSFVLAAMEAIAYNDGPLGRNRVVVQLAGVHAESRYGITVVPNFDGIGFRDGVDGFADDGSPDDRAGIPDDQASSDGSFTAQEIVEMPDVVDVVLASDEAGLGSHSTTLARDPIRRFLRSLPDAVRDIVRLLIQHPREFALLMLVFGLLGTPPYLAYRRRVLTGLVAVGAARD